MMCKWHCIHELPRRLLVVEGSYSQACRLLQDADLGQWIVQP